MALRLSRLVNRRLLFLLLLFLALPPLSSQAQQEGSRIGVNELVDEALRNNPEILAAKRKWEAYKEKVPQARALPDPMAGFGIVNLPTSLRFNQEDMTMKEFSVSQQFPFYGKRRLAGEMAGKEAEAVYSEIQERVNRVVNDVKSAYYDLSHVYRTTEVTEGNKKVMETFARIAETKYSVGQGIQQDVLKAHVEVSKMVDELLTLGQRKKALNAKLIALLNRPPDASLGEPEEVAFEKVTINLEELQKTAEAANPTLEALRKMIEAKKKAYQLAKREYYPDFDLKFAYGQRDNIPGKLRQDMLTGMVEINVPIFYKEKQDRKVAETYADILNYESQYRAARNEIFSMIADAAAMIERRERQFELYRTGIIPETSLQVDSAMAAYKVNKADFLTLLDSQLTLYRYEIEYHQALTEYEKSIANLEAVVGKEVFGKGAE